MNTLVFPNLYFYFQWRLLPICRQLIDNPMKISRHVVKVLKTGFPLVLTKQECLPALCSANIGNRVFPQYTKLAMLVFLYSWKLKLCSNIPWQILNYIKIDSDRTYLEVGQKCRGYQLFVLRKTSIVNPSHKPKGRVFSKMHRPPPR